MHDNAILRDCAFPGCINTNHGVETVTASYYWGVQYLDKGTQAVAAAFAGDRLVLCFIREKAGLQCYAFTNHRECKCV